MGWSLNTQGETLSGSQQLKVGSNRTLIVSAGMVVNKNDPKGLEQQVVFDLQQGEDHHCKVFLSVMSSDKVVAGIAEKTVRSFAQAAGITGVLKPETLKKFAGKYVVVNAVEKAGTGKNDGKTFVNISTVEPDDDDNDPEEKEPEEEPEEEEKDTPEPEPTEKPKKSRPW